MTVRAASEEMSIIWLSFLISSMLRSTSPSSLPITSSRAWMNSAVRIEICRLSPIASSSYAAISVLITSSARFGMLLFIEMVTIEASLLATSHFTAAR